MRWMSLIVEWKTSANMFYLLKHLLLIILVIFKLKCNNLIFNEIVILNASYVCLHAFSLCQESPNPDPRRRTPHFWGGSVTIYNYASRSTITQRESYPDWVVGNPIMKSIAISSHFHTGICEGCNNPVIHCCSALTLLQVLQRATYSATSLFIPYHH
jgi:hypothetical protein